MWVDVNLRGTRMNQWVIYASDRHTTLPRPQKYHQTSEPSRSIFFPVMHGDGFKGVEGMTELTKVCKASLVITESLAV